ncbi:hypothetical protein TNCV_208211 [Trichonephila clavipes]|uniref:Uncharacterized protein n=1 Tax=Trichonephila clavipes TaxID=2585209 RepID=A0A8X6SUC2_TRICX|nr:hypothetical protein TNCV_208211 [Trichonephila clavipes]
MDSPGSTGYKLFLLYAPLPLRRFAARHVCSPVGHQSSMKRPFQEVESAVRSFRPAGYNLFLLARRCLLGGPRRVTCALGLVTIMDANGSRSQRKTHPFSLFTNLINFQQTQNNT